MGGIGNRRQGPRHVQGRAVDELIDELYAAALPISIESEHRVHYIERGFRLLSSNGSRESLLPPTAIDDLHLAGSVCAFWRAGGEVLLGRRLTPPWHGYWAFPGGSLEPGESALEGARRELHEETAVVAGATPVLETTVYVSTGVGDRIYAVTNFVIPVDSRLEAKTTDEIEPHWVTLAEAFAKSPMASGTARVLKRLRERWLGSSR